MMKPTEHKSTSRINRPSIACQMWDVLLASFRQGHNMQRMLNQYR